jgi:hypothetical protein
MTPVRETMGFLARPVEGLTNHDTLPEVQKARAMWDKRTPYAPSMGKDVRNKMHAAYTVFGEAEHYQVTGRPELVAKYLNAFDAIR